MALARNDSLAPYGGGGQRQRSRGYVTVREPAKGFFIAGSSLEAMNGIYGPLRPDAQPVQQLRHRAQIAYQNDETGWLLVLTQPAKRPEPQRRRTPAPRPGGYGGGRRQPVGARLRGAVISSSSEEQDEEEEDEDLAGELLGDEGEPCEPEWCFVDTTGRERFAHEGNTVIPGAGYRWRHLHRAAPAAPGVAGGPGCAKAATRVELLWYDCQEDGYETPAQDEDELAARVQAPTPPPCRPCTRLAAAEPDDENELPWQVIAVLDASVIQDLRAAYRHYQRQIAAAMAGAGLPKAAPTSLEACSMPGSWAYRVVVKEGVEVRTAPSGHARWCDHRAQGQYVSGVERRGAWLRLSRCAPGAELGRRGPGGPASRQVAGGGEGEEANGEELWVLMEDRHGKPLLEVVPEADSASLHAPPDDGAEAEVFDRPFEPRLAPRPGDGGAGAGQAGGEEELRRGSDELQHHEAREAEVPEPGSLLHEVHLAVGTQVSLEGLCDARHNGELATVVSPRLGDGRCTVRLAKDGALLGVRALHLRPVLASEGGKKGRAARILGLSLAELNLSGATEPPAAWASAKERLAAARRAAERDALGAGATEALEDARQAHEALLQDIRDCGETDVPTPLGADPPSPHAAVESGALGLRAALAARAAASGASAAGVAEGVGALRQLLRDEQRRLASDAGLQWPLRAASLPLMPPEGSDALRLRLTLVRALLRGRCEQEALREASQALRAQPAAAAASLWVGRCLLRLARREEGIRALTTAVDGGPSGGADAAWGRTGAVVRLRALRCADRTRGSAEDAYAYGAFDRAAELYGEALTSSPSDDKWGRAMLHAGRAACHRRARALAKAVEDCDAALALFPRYARAEFRRGICLLELGRPAEALQSFQKLLRMDRNWPKLCEWLVRAHAQAKRQERGAGSGAPGTRGARGRSTGSLGGSAGAEEAEELGGADLYAVLGVSSDATEKQLKQAYRLMSLKYHPDKKGGSTRAFQDIATAYQTLSEPEKRRAFDEGADVKKKKTREDSSDSDERDERSLFEEVERRYFPERYRFWPFGDPFIEKRKLQARRKREAGQRQQQQAWMDEDD